jgi:hypothetical protein
VPQTALHRLCWAWWRRLPRDLKPQENLHFPTFKKPLKLTLTRQEQIEVWFLTETTLSLGETAGLVIDDPLPLSFPALPQQAFFNLRENLVKPLFCPIHFRFVKLNFGL